MSASNQGSASLLDAMFTAWGATLYVGLSTTTPTSTGGNVTEPSGGGYARQPITAASMNAATVTDPSSKTNSAVIDYGTASADWSGGANQTHWVLYDAVTAGTMVAHAALDTPQPVLNGNPVSFQAGDFELTLT